MKTDFQAARQKSSGWNPLRLEAAPIVYRINSDDRLVFVSEGRDHGARDGAESAVPPADRSIGHSLWEFIPDAAVREVYRQIIATVRAGRTLHTTCHSSTGASRQAFELTVAPCARGEIEFSMRPRAEVLHPSQARPKPEAPRRGTLVRMCSWCHAIAAPGTPAWQPLETAIGELGLLQGDQTRRVTHGICPACAEKMWAEIRAEAGGNIVPSAGPALRR